MEKQLNQSQALASYVGAFFDELLRAGVKDVVVSPGSRSTPLAVMAFVSDMCVHVDIDERGAAFVALGLAKASGRPVAVLCTSGTATANYYPAVLEAESSRVPLLVLTGDRPARLQNLGAPQTCDQLHMFGTHVKLFQQMPPVEGCTGEAAVVRQKAREAFIAASGAHASYNDVGQIVYTSSSTAGPVHLNFPFDEPLMPDISSEGMFEAGRTNGEPCFQAVSVSYPDASSMQRVHRILRAHRTVVLCGEGSVSNEGEARMLLQWAQRHQYPLLVDPLSGMRSYDDALVIDNYDTLFSGGKAVLPSAVIRFGRYPVSKACSLALAKEQPLEIVVDVAQTRDFLSLTSSYIPCTPAAFVASSTHDDDKVATDNYSLDQKQFADTWVRENDEAAQRLSKVRGISSGFEGAYVERLLSLMPASSILFAASSLAIRMIDTFSLKGTTKCRILCNRGLNGIDGCTSAAIGAALTGTPTTLLTGDLAFLHDCNALLMHQELMLAAQDMHLQGETPPSLVIVVTNNQGGGIFDTLPQRSQDAYFERLFITPQQVDIAALAQGFGVPYVQVANTDEFEAAYAACAGRAGIHIIEVPVPLDGVKERYAEFLV